jgi:lysophospholipase L1-like esterase
MRTLARSSEPIETRTETEAVTRRRSTPPPLGWFLFGGCLAGIAFGLTVALDFNWVTKPLAFVAAAVAHGCLGVIAIDVVTRLRSRGDATRWGAALSIGGLMIAAVGLAILLWKLDVVVVESYASHTTKVLYLLSGFVAIIGFGLGAWLVFSPATFTGQKERVGWRVLAGLTSFTAGVVAIALVVGVAAAWRQNDVPEDAVPVPPIRGIDGDYVALGDSYSAGEGLGHYADGTDDGGDRCHRSALGYPSLLTFDDQATHVSSRACSGAMSVDVYQSFQRSSGVTIEAQLDGEVHPEVGLVTITIGGNDVVFSRIVRHCFLFEDCIHATFRPREPNRPSVEYPGQLPLEEWAEATVASLSPRMSRVASELRRQYPEARVVMIGYPYLFPDGSPPWDQADCASVLRRVNQRERLRLRQMTDDLNNFLYAHAVAAGIEFVSPAAAWDGHEPCGTDGQYTNAIKPVLSLPNIVDGGTFHPNQRGQEQLARLVSCYLGEHPSPPDPFADEVSRPLDIHGFVDLDELGIVPPPGSIDEPVNCG